MALTGERKREKDRNRLRAKTAQGQDIGQIPSIVDAIRRRDCIADFELYCKTYHAAEFDKPWADYQRRMAARIQNAAETGGWRAEAVPRGGGKTTLCACGIEWAALRGSHKYPIIVAASKGLAVKILKGIKMQLYTNELLLEDFPHAVYPIRCAKNEARRAGGQTYDSEKTMLEWNSERIVLPWIEEEESLSDGVVIEAFGMEGAIRGLKHTRPDTSTVRPDLALVDDPQTRESAKSPSQTQSRLEILTGDIAYLAGPGESLAVFCPCTVIYTDDLADGILNREKHPEWQGERTRMVESFPANIELWDKYADIRRASLREDGDGQAATKFYLDNRTAMDAGSSVSWEHRRKPTEISAIQHAMNLKIRDEASFYAEMQNEPVQKQDDLELLSSDKIAEKVMGNARGVVPDDCAVVTAFTDVQKEHLFWMVVAWTNDFTGFILDYGAWPEQGRNYFTRREIRKKLSTTYKGDESGQIFAALTDLGAKLAGTPYRSKSGRELSLARWCIDGNWRSRTAAIESYAKQSPYKAVITVTQGRGVKATENPFSQAQRAIRWRTGPGWFWVDGPGPARWVTFDANLWKKRIHEGLSMGIGSRSSIQLFNAPPHAHQMLADHLRAEKPVKNESNGRTVYEWQEIPGRDNEGLDCLVGCAVGASIEKIQRASERPAAVQAKARVSLSEIQRKRRGA